MKNKIQKKKLSGRFDVGHRPWRTLVRVVDIAQDGDYFYVVIPAWSSLEKIRVSFDDIPQTFRNAIAPEKRFHATVNIGAERHEDIYICDWKD